MSAVLALEDWGRWLAPEEFTEVGRKEMLRPAADETMDFWPVSRAVGNARNEGAELFFGAGQDRRAVALLPGKPASFGKRDSRS